MSGFENSRLLYREHARKGSLGFSHPINQRTRFAGARRHVTFTGKSVLDFGCGHGDLLHDLVCAGELPASWHGVDLVPENLGIAAQRTRELLGQDPARFAVRLGPAPEGRYAITCCLAVLSVDEGPDTEWLWERTLTELWSHTEEALIFDLLREEEGRPHPGHRRLEPERIAAIAAGLSRNHLIDNTLAEHYSLVVCRRGPTATRRYWGLCDG